MLNWILFDGREVLWALLGVFLCAQVGTLATTVYLHRGLAHRSVELHPMARWLMRLTIWLTTGIAPREWAAVHRKHHRFADTEGDPHSPYVHGFWQIQLLNLHYYRREAADAAMVKRYSRDIGYDAWDRLFDKTTLGPILFVLTWIAVFGPLLGTAAGFGSFGLYIFLNASINGAAHWIGYQNFSNTARNLWLLALLTAGEGLHNNHHEYPGSSRFSQKWWEIDLGWWTISLLRALKLARVAPSAGLA